MKLKLLSFAAAVGALSAVIIALTALTGELGKLVRAIADEWHAIKASENAQEMGGDIAHAAGIAWGAITLISWPSWVAISFVLIVVPLAWHRLITAPRHAEKSRVINELADRATARLEHRARAESDDA